MKGEKMSTPRLTLGHSTLAARDLDRLSTFYCDVLGFHVTNRGPVGDDGAELAFLSQDPATHHQVAMTGGVAPPDAAFVLAIRRVGKAALAHRPVSREIPF